MTMHTDEPRRPDAARTGTEDPADAHTVGPQGGTTYTVQFPDGSPLDAADLAHPASLPAVGDVVEYLDHGGETHRYRVRAVVHTLQPAPSAPGELRSGLPKVILETAPDAPGHEVAWLDSLREIAAAFDRHDLDAIMSRFAPDAVFEAPRGPEPWGVRVQGPGAIRAAFADRFAGIPDARYLDDTHFVSGNRGCSQWTLRGTTADGTPVEVRGCDLWTFRDGRVTVKDSYWKIRSS